MNQPNDDRTSHEDERVVFPELEAALHSLRQQSPDEEQVTRVIARAVALAHPPMPGMPIPHPRQRSRRIRLMGYGVVASTLIAIVVFIVVRPPVSFERRVPQASKSHDSPLVGITSTYSPVIVLPLTTVAYHGIERDLDETQDRLQEVPEQSLLAEIRREAQETAEHYRNWNDDRTPFHGSSQ